MSDSLRDDHATATHGGLKSPRLQALNQRAIDACPELLDDLLDGKVMGIEYHALNPTRDDEHLGSFRITFTGPRAGLWCDFAIEGAKGGNFISLVGYVLGLDFKAAAKELERRLDLLDRQTATQASSKAKPAASTRTSTSNGKVPFEPILPVPDDAPNHLAMNHGLGYSLRFTYRDAEGKLQGYALRFDQKDGQKRYLPLTYCRNLATGDVGWEPHQFHEPRPLYGLHRLATKPGVPVIVVEGEKAAVAAKRAFPGWVAITSPGGSQAAKKADWSPLAGRVVIIWPDNDEAGLGYARTVAALAWKAGAKAVSIVDLARVATIRNQGALPKGWDVADAAGFGDAPGEGWLKPDLLDQESVLVPVEQPKEGDAAAAPDTGDSGVDDDGYSIVNGVRMLRICVNAPDEVAASFIKETFTWDGARTLHRYREEWLLWDNSRYEAASQELVRAITYRFLRNCCYVVKNEVVPVAPTPALVSHLLDALAARCHVCEGELPRWLGKDAGQRPAPRDVIGFNNGLLDTAAWVASGVADLAPHTPRWLSTNVTDLSFDPGATCPGWLRFLAEVLDNDSERIEALRRWFGYCLTSDTSLHLIAFLLGPPRSGKGTVLHLLKLVVGAHNTCSPALSDLGTQFGFQPLLGKTLAVVGEVHLGRSANRAAIVEVLKRVSGEDPVDANRKFLPQLAGVHLPVRFTLAGNEMPNLPDASNALAARLLVINFARSFEGEEDRGLKARLEAEAPGILAWALEGLRALRADGCIAQPSVGKAVMRDFRLASSPAQEWVESCCTVDGKASVEVQRAYAHWRLFCKANGHEPGGSASFGQKLRAAANGVERVKVGPRDSRRYVYQGVRLTDEAEAEVAGWQEPVGLRRPGGRE